MQEMVLVVNALRNDLLHPNEYIRGQMCRFLCKLKEVEVLEPLMPSIRACLVIFVLIFQEHKHPYVRKNAVLTILSIYKSAPNLIPDASELMLSFLNQEADQGARRNALIMLISCDLEKAVLFFHQVQQSIASFDEGIQLAFVELIRKDCKRDGADKAKYIQTILALLTTSSPSVKFEAASTLPMLTSHASAIKSVASCYIDLCLKASDNNVKLIVLSQISELPRECLQDLTMDILRIVASPDMSVKSKTLNLAIELTTSKNVQGVCQFLKKELQKTLVEVFDKQNEYRQLLIGSIHSCALQYPSVANDVVHVLMDFVSDTNTASQDDVISFVKEVMEKFPHMRGSITERLLMALPTLKTSRVVF